MNGTAAGEPFARLLRSLRGEKKIPMGKAAGIKEENPHPTALIMITASKPLWCPCANIIVVNKN